MENKQRILFISPHTDDVELGAGGTLIRFLKENKEVYVVAFCGAKESLRQHGHPENLLALEFQAAMNYIGVPQSNYFLLDFPLREFSSCRQLILDKLIELKESINPDLVIIPSKNDNHQDHEVIHAEAVRAFKNRSIWCYELPWNQMKFNGSCYVKLDKEIVDQKIEMLKNYKSQSSLSRAYFKEDFLRGLAHVRGCQSFTEYAEAFEVIREYI
jgi:LmbE family N-acetylglucosaminyl deacetylase